MRWIALFLIVASALGSARPAHAVWAESGNAVGNSASFREHFRSGSAGHSAVCADMRGGLICAYWKDASSTPDSLIVNRLDRLGNRQWNGSAGFRVGPFEGSNSGITVLSDGDAGAWVVYTIDFSGTGFTLGTYAQHFDPNGAASIPFPGVRVGRSGSGVSFGSPLAAVTTSGKLIVLLLGQGPIGGTDSVRVQRVTQAGALEWTAGGVLLGTSTQVGNDMQAFRVLADGEGAVSVWSEETNSTGPARVRASRVNSSGVEQWTAGGTTVFQDANFDVQMADAIWDDANGLTVAFSAADLADTGSDLFVTRLTPLGAVNASWGSATTAVRVVNNSASGGNLRDLGLVTDGAGGCIVGWVDNRNSQVVGARGHEVPHRHPGAALQPRGRRTVDRERRGGGRVGEQSVRPADDE